ncbi:deleted in malignant brain tumors 1 protein-like [Denticeps clupeoides]|uniref:deleted in malignant brain tumors 1 protein-like n=1 Tax=Denticeps clupeoides TaxID=299321 RepID=UPI0010A4D091|nr:deleted in malignant brain tumors 1 protein-like [Denticeps clupeoides]
MGWGLWTILIYSVVLASAEDSVRLVNGTNRCSGRVEVFYKGQWGRLCAGRWDMRPATVLCQELGCGAAVAVTRNDEFGRGSGPNINNTPRMYVDVGILELSNQGINCSYFGIISGVRLVGPGACSGRVEVLRGKTWGSVCEAAFDQQDAEVACRELGCGALVEVLGSATFGHGEGQVWSEEIQCRGHESQIHFCPTSPEPKHDCPHEKTVGLVCGDKMRLVNGTHRCSGRLEVNQDGEWGTVCGDYWWDMHDASVVCREQGCGEPVDAVEHASFGQGSGPILMHEVHCWGTESRLKNCMSQDNARFFCGHDKDAGVICSGVRLVGPTSCSGRVEVLRGNYWESVCDAAFDLKDAEVVCREMSCGAPVEVLGGTAFGEAEGPIWTEEIQCKGNESQIHFCPVSSAQKQTCSHKNDVGLVCADGLRLVNGSNHCSGRVEMFHKGQWGTVCGDYWWNIPAAEVVCRELGCGYPSEAPKDGRFGEGTGPIWTNEVYCSGSESRLRNCKSRTVAETQCTHHQDAGVICTGVRLVGPSPCSGRVEVLYGKSWQTVCDAAFDQQDAEVVCRELDCGTPVKMLGAAAYGKGSGKVLTEEFQCKGNETQIQFCPKSSKQKDTCSHDSDVGLLCSGDIRESVRLVNGTSGCSGRVEFYHEGQWECSINLEFHQFL